MKILVCDDHALFREGLGHVLRQLDEHPQLLEAADAEETLRVVAENDDLDLLLLDLNIPGMDGLAALRVLRRRFPAVPVVMVSASDRSEDARAALDAGASGFIPKSTTGPVLLGALRLVLSGGVYVPPLLVGARGEGERSGNAPGRRARACGLTQRQLEVLELLSRGLTNKDICRVLGIAEGTTKAHVAAILEILQVSNRTEAVTVMHELGLKPATRE